MKLYGQTPNWPTEPRRCGVSWASPIETLDPDFRCSNQAEFIAIPVGTIDDPHRSYFVVCARCKDLCKGLDHWAFAEIPKKYQEKRK